MKREYWIYQKNGKVKRQKTFPKKIKKDNEVFLVVQTDREINIIPVHFPAVAGASFQ